MKRLLVVLLSVVYLAASSGFTLRQHYCMGQLIGTAIDHPVHYSDTHSCTKCGMTKKSDDNGCCKDKVKTFKTSPDQLPAKALSFPGVTVFDALPQSAFRFVQDGTFECSISIVAAPAHGPPFIPDLPIYLQVRSLLI